MASRERRTERPLYKYGALNMTWTERHTVEAAARLESRRQTPAAAPKHLGLCRRSSPCQFSAEAVGVSVWRESALSPPPDESSLLEIKVSLLGRPTSLMAGAFSLMYKSASSLT